MNNERVCFEHINRSLTIIDTKAFVQLTDTDVCKQERTRCLFSHNGKGIIQPIMHKRGALRADTHGNVKFVSCLGKNLIELLGFAGPSGHRRDQNWSVQFLFKYDRRKIDIIKIDFWQAFNLKLDLVKTCRNT